MIVRILGEGQFEVPEATGEELERLDAKLNAAFDAREEEIFGTLLDEIGALIRSDGKELDATEIVPSDLTVPHLGSSIDDLRRLLTYGTDA